MQYLIKFSKRINRSLNGLAPRKFLIIILQYISEAMGKKLRSRQIEDITDEDANLQCPFDLPSTEIDQCGLRRLIIRKNEKKSLKHEQKTRRFKHRLASAQFDQIISETAFECSICLELMVAPTMMLCGHMFCHKCLESSNVYNQNCSLCRRSQDQEQFVLNLTAQRIIHQFILPRTDNFLGYLCRMTDSEEWGKRRKAGNVRVNQIIDFQDILNIWRKGTVVAVLKENQVLMVRVKITIKGDDFFETVEANSRRIAPFTFFTKKKYLEDFVPSLAQYQPKQIGFMEVAYSDVQVTEEYDYWSTQSPSQIGQSAYPFSLYQQRAEESLEQEMKLFHHEMEQHHLFL